MGALKKEKKVIGYADRTKYFLEWRSHRELHVSIIACLGTLLHVVLTLPRESMLTLCMCILLLVTYPILKRFKLTGFKNLASSLPISVPVVLFPALIHCWSDNNNVMGGNGDHVVWKLITWIFALVLRGMASDMVFDCFDIQGDKADKVATVAVSHGVSTTTNIASAMMFVAAFLSALAGVHGCAASAWVAAVSMAIGGHHEYNHLYEACALIMFFWPSY